MIDKTFADHFAADWIDSWNQHDLARILSHYTDDFETSSPVIINVASEPSGTLKGKEAVGSYWTKVDAFSLKREKILFAAFAGWDAAGAKSFGYPTFWVNRLNMPEEKLGSVPYSIGKTLVDLVGFVKSSR
jgi:hypothetical protein